MEISVTMNDQEIDDLRKALIIAMKELDKYTRGTDRILCDRLLIFLSRIDKKINSSLD